ncbi:MAG TPA: prepilin peptidase [Thermoanaerobaculia bacterium]|nr:prepilin peptidase [Thermoanaerobaculia bacterium]
MQLSILLAIYAAVLGLIVGSYLNVVIYRLPRGLSTVFPRSGCPSCGAPIRARDNLPVVSFLVLGGRCRACRTPISWRYPAIEAATSLLFVASFLRFGPSLAALAAALFCCLMVVLAMIDLEHMILPDRITLPGIAVGLALQPFLPWGGWRPALIGAALGAGILIAVWGLWYMVRREEGMGLGDVKMLALIGAFLGWKGVLVALFFSTLAGATVGLVLMRWGSLEMRSKLPFGTFLALGGLVALFFGTPIADWYAGLL